MTTALKTKYPMPPPWQMLPRDSSERSRIIKQRRAEAQSLVGRMVRGSLMQDAAKYAELLARRYDLQFTESKRPHKPGVSLVADAGAGDVR